MTVVVDGLRASLDTTDVTDGILAAGGDLEERWDDAGSMTVTARLPCG